MNQEQIVDLIIKTINTIITNIFSSVDNSIYEILDDITFIDNGILTNSYFEKLLGANGKTGLLYLADAMLVSILIFYIVRFYYSNITDRNVEKPSQFLFKVIIFAILINFSYFLFDQILNISGLITSSIQEIGKDVIHQDISFSNLIVFLNKKLNADVDFNLFSFNGILKSFISFGLMNLLFTYSLRYVIFQVLILLCPFAILCLINTSTAWIFKAWAKCLFSLLVLQFFIAIIIILVFCIDGNNILLIGGIYALMRINSYVREMFGGLSIDVSGNFNSMMNFIKR